MTPNNDLYSVAGLLRVCRVVLLFYLLCFSPCFCEAQSETFTTRYCLDLRIRDPNFSKWNTFSYIRGTGGQLCFDFDRDSGRLHITQSNNFVHNVRCRFTLRMQPWQQLLLPASEAGQADIAIETEGKNLEMCRLIVRSTDRYERPLFADTVSLFSNGRRERFSTRVPLKDAVFLYLAIEADGDGRDYANYPTGFAPVDSTSDQSLTLSGFDIRLDGRPLDDFPVESRMKVCVPDPKSAVPLSFESEEGFGHIPQLNDKRVVALGETAHGSETMSRAAFQSIRHRIRNEGCRLVLLEEHWESMLALNRYVRGEDDGVLDSLLLPFRYSINNSSSFRDFCQWLRNYNRTTEEKVSLMGMDTDWTEGRPIARNRLLKYLMMRNERSRSLAVYSVCKFLLTPVKPPYDDVGEIERLLALWNCYETQLKTVLGSTDYEIVRLGLNNSLRWAPDGKIKVVRDRVMAENAKSLTELLCPDDRKVTIYCHFTHANYREVMAYFTPSTGFYLKEAWGDNYGCIGLHAAEGEYLVWESPARMIVEKVSPPQKYSLESFLSEVPHDYFFMPSDRVPPVATVRWTGRYVFGTPFSGVFSPEGRMDGHIFVRRSEAMSLRPEDRDKDVMQRSLWQDEFRRLRSCYETQSDGIVPVQPVQYLW